MSSKVKMTHATIPFTSWLLRSYTAGKIVLPNEAKKWLSFFTKVHKFCMTNKIWTLNKWLHWMSIPTKLLSKIFSRCIKHDKAVTQVEWLFVKWVNIEPSKHFFTTPKILFGVVHTISRWKIYEIHGVQKHYIGFWKILERYMEECTLFLVEYSTKYLSKIK